MQSKHDDSSAVTLVMKDGKEIRASRSELSAACDFFSTLLNSDMRENREGIIRLNHISRAVMRNVLEFMRSGSVMITPNNAEALVEAADYLLLQKLKTTAEIFLGQEMSTLNCISIYYLAEKYQCDGLIVNSRNFIVSHFAAVVDESQEFLNLESQQVEQWICSDDIAVTNENDVFKIILEWIEQNKSERRGKFEELFRHVRLPFVSRDYLRMHVVTNDLVKENSRYLKLVKDALKGIYRPIDDHPQSPRKWSETHLVVLRGMETLCYQPDEDTWYQLTHAPFYHGHCYLNESFETQPYHVSVLLGKMYVFPSPAYHGDIEIYDPMINCWFQLVPTEEHLHEQHTETHIVRRWTARTDVAVVGTQMYSINSIMEKFFDRNSNFHCQPFRSPSSFCSISKYSVESNTWNVVVSKIQEIQAGACAVAMDNYLYVLGGWCNYFYGGTTYAARLDTAGNKWERIQDMKMERKEAFGIAAHGKIFVAGGVKNNTCEVYNISTNEWQLIARLNAPRSKASMLCFGGTLYVVGGEHVGRGRRCRDGSYWSPDSIALTVESYDFKNDEWKQRTKIPAVKDVKVSPNRKYDGNDFIKACTLNVPNRVLGKPIGKSKGLMASFKQVFQR